MDSLDKQRYYYLGHVLYAKCVRGEKVEDDELLQRIAIKQFPVTLQEMKDLCGLELDTVQEKRYKALTKDSLETLQHLQASDLISEDIANYVLIDYMNNYDHIYREQKKLMIRLTNYINSITRTNYQFTLGRIDHLDL